MGRPRGTIGHLGHDLLDSLRSAPRRACELQREVGAKHYQTVHESLCRLRSAALVCQDATKRWEITQAGRARLEELDDYREPGVVSR